MALTLVLGVLADRQVWVWRDDLSLYPPTIRVNPCSFTANNSYGDVIVTLIFGAIGYLMVIAGWPRAPFVLGLVLGKIAENYLYISVARYEAAWLYRPVVLVLIALALVVICYPFMRARFFGVSKDTHAQ